MPARRMRLLPIWMVSASRILAAPVISAAEASDGSSRASAANKNFLDMNGRRALGNRALGESAFENRAIRQLWCGFGRSASGFADSSGLRQPHPPLMWEGGIVKRF